MSVLNNGLHLATTCTKMQSEIRP